MKILFYYRVNRAMPHNQGVISKCRSQASALRSLGHEVDEIYLCPEGVLHNEKLLYSFSFPFLSHHWSKYAYYFLLLLWQVGRRVDFKSYDLLLIRYPMTHPLMDAFIRKARLKNPRLRIILEFPTYPYDREPTGWAHRFSLWLDKLYRERLKKNVDFVLHYGLEKEVYGIPTIRITNGIQLRGIPLSRSVPQPNTLRLIALANWSYWHGLDRLITGLAKYYSGEEKKNHIELVVIGEGKALPEYKKLVKQYELQEVVRFFSPASGALLDEYFDHADMGVGTLGIFRKGVAIDSSLKHREYCARGIPFVLSAPDLSFPENLSFVHAVAEREKAIDIHELWNFWESLCRENGDLRQKMRAYAIKELSWEKQMRKLFATDQI